MCTNIKCSPESTETVCTASVDSGELRNLLCMVFLMLRLHDKRKKSRLNFQHAHKW